MNAQSSSHCDTIELNREDSMDDQYHLFDSTYPPTDVEVKGVLGEGGMGIVYLAQQSFPRREVAIKTPRKDNPNNKWNLLQEAMTAGSLEHPNIIPIHSVNMNGSDGPEVIMKRVDGKNLEQILFEAPLTDARLRIILQYLIQICNALEYAHSKEVYHRDIKPENIMIGNFGEVYLLDWGLALSKQDHQGVGGIVGTPGFMAPEMISGNPEDVDQRTDVYMMGATLHYILTGSVRNQMKGDSIKLENIQFSIPYTYGPQVPTELTDLITFACQKEPVDRLPTIALFRQHLTEFLLHRDAFLLSRSAKDELQQFLKIRSSANVEKEIRKLHFHFNRARFGFEQALNIWPQSTHAQKGLQVLIGSMIEYYLETEQLETAENLATVLHVVSPEMQEKISALRSKKQIEAQESKRLMAIGKKHDPTTSFWSRLILAAGGMFACGVFIFFLYQVNSIKPTELSAEILFTHAAFALLPMIPILLLTGKSLFNSVHGRRAFIGIAGGLIAMLLHRWIGIQYEIPPMAIMITDIFIIGLAMANAGPSVRSGPAIALFCVFVGLINHFFPTTFWIGSFLLVTIIFLAIFTGGLRGWWGRK